MLKERGFRFYTQSLAGVMLLFVFVAVFGFATTATAAKKPCKDDQGSPHCHIGDHSSDTSITTWDARVIIFEDGIETHDGWLTGEFPKSHIDIASTTAAEVCTAVHDQYFGDVHDITSGDLFIDVHQHNHDADGNGVPTGGTEPPDNGGNTEAGERDDHWHTLEAQCFVGSSGKNNGKGGGKGKKN